MGAIEFRTASSSIEATRDVQPHPPTGQGAADHDSVNGTILVELMDLVLNLLRFTGGIELDFVEIHTAAQCQLLLLLNETLSISIVTKTDQRQTGNHARLLLDMAQTQRGLFRDLVANPPAIKDTGRVGALNKTLGSENRHGATIKRKK